MRTFVERDSGMYDALNRGLRRCRGEILAYLNCDEQYLPGTLRLVEDYFSQHPRVQVMFGDVIFVDAQGAYLCHRKMMPPLRYHTWTCHLSTLSCGMFFRRSIFFERGFEFDPTLRDAGDAEWILRLLAASTTMATLGTFTSVFTRTGANMSTGANAVRENRALRHTAPRWSRLARPLWVAHHRLRRWAGGMYSQPPFEYAVYTRGNPSVRKQFQVTTPIGTHQR